MLDRRIAMWRNEGAANGVEPTASAKRRVGTKKPLLGIPAVPKYEGQLPNHPAQRWPALRSCLGVQTVTDAQQGLLSGSPRHGGDCTAALTLTMDREAMEAEETASNDRPMTQAPERDKRISALTKRTCAVQLAMPEDRLDGSLCHNARAPRRQAQRTDLR